MLSILHKNVYNFTYIIQYTIVRTYTHFFSERCKVTALEANFGRKYLKTVCYQGLKAVFKCHNSEDLYEVSDQIGCYQSSYSLACENDPTFYQICGLNPCSAYRKVTPSTTFSCGSWLCEEKTTKISYSGRSRLNRYRCNDQDECANTDFDESYCISEFEFQCKHTGSSYSISEKCDLKCDCFHCDDEAFCNGFSYGYSCHFDTSYRSSPNMCNNLASYGCKKECKKEPIVTYCKPGAAYYLKYPKDIRPVYRTQICAVPEVLEKHVTCRDGLDQVNCADPKRVALRCTMDGTLITVSLFALCKGYQLCDDDYQNLVLKLKMDVNSTETYYVMAIRIVRVAGTKSSTFVTHQKVLLFLAPVEYP